MSENLNTLNPAVMQAFVDHYRDRRLLDRLEDCILHMEMTYVDFHQVVVVHPALTVGPGGHALQEEQALAGTHICVQQRA